MKKNNFDFDNLHPVVFTPGVPTEDGWYVVKVRFNGIDTYETIDFVRREPIHPNADDIILSHAKLPEL